jgi:hypothetical protein
MWLEEVGFAQRGIGVLTRSLDDCDRFVSGADDKHVLSTRALRYPLNEEVCRGATARTITTVSLEQSSAGCVCGDEGWE